MAVKRLLDLCCGLGGWSVGFAAEGWECVGCDIADFSKEYPGRFFQADLLTWEGWREFQFNLVVASPPCEEYSRWDMPWTRARGPQVPDARLWERCFLIARQAGVPIVLENVRGAQQFWGRSKMNVGPFHLWGDVPALVPQVVGRRKSSRWSNERVERAVVPVELARGLGRMAWA